MTTGLEMGRDEFDVLLNDVLRTVANPEVPERVRVRTRVWVMELAGDTSARGLGQPAAWAPTRDGETVANGAPMRPAPAVFAPEVFLAQMSARRDARTTVAAVLLHAAAIALLFWTVKTHVALVKPQTTAMVDLTVAPPQMELKKDAMGGGGGQRGPAPASQGHLPKFADQQITAPRIPVETKIPMPDASIEVQKDLKMANNNLPNIGLPNSSLIGNSMGNGKGSGMGSGDGAGLGAGVGSGYGGGLRKIGGGVSAPVVIFKVEPEFSEEARKAKFMGNVLVTLVVDPQGMPRNVRVVQGAGMGLDEKAVEAVKQYRFRPAMENGKPVAVQMNVDVEFQIF